ncbi:MAG TPA: nucleoside hydrolase [Candidatus Limnocylindrales bacterium]|nr:nucleoside hydrolase [Candidatus Limnocylindrales bacterium]
MSAGYNVEEWGPVHAIPTYHKAEAGERTAPFGTPEQPIPLIIDSDPGLDDALAIGLAAASSEIELLAVTTVGGNADVTRCTDNALRLLHAYGRDDVPVAEGAAGALLGSVVRATEVHGESGIGSAVLDAAPGEARPEGAVALIARILAEHPDPVAIAPIGPLTNIALVLRLYPHLAGRISHLCLMGGSIGEGNTTASAEFNIVADPEAADVVFRSGVPITMIGLDVTHQALLDRESAAELRALGNVSGRVAAELTDYALDRNLEWSGSTTTAIHDAVAVAHLIVPDLVQVAPYHVAVDTTNGPARGRTVCDGLPYRLRRDGRTPNADVGIVIDRPRFERLLIDAFARLP